MKALKNIAKRVVAQKFHEMWYHANDTWQQNTYLGHSVWQNPMDLHLYQELIYQVKPDFILQTGVAGGGSILYYANLLDAMKAPESAIVIGIDIEISQAARSIDHPRVRLFEGSSTDPAIVSRVRDVLPSATGFVILDSDHSQRHVTDEIAIYKDFVALNSYMVVEDTNINGHPVLKQFGPGPREAVELFIPTQDKFIVDTIAERNRITHHDWLKRIK